MHVLKNLDSLSVYRTTGRRLRQDVQYFLNRALVSKLPLLQGLDDRIVLSLAELLKREVSMAGDVIIRAGDLG